MTWGEYDWSDDWKPLHERYPTMDIATWTPVPASATLAKAAQEMPKCTNCGAVCPSDHKPQRVIQPVENAIWGKDLQLGDYARMKQGKDFWKVVKLEREYQDASQSMFGVSRSGEVIYLVMEHDDGRQQHGSISERTELFVRVDVPDSLDD